MYLTFPLLLHKTKGLYTILYSICEKSLSIFPIDGECHKVCDCIFLQVHRTLWVMMWYLASVLCSVYILIYVELVQFYIWSYVMSVGGDRKIDIYPVSIKAMSFLYHSSFVLQKSHSNYSSSSSIHPSYCIQFSFVYIVITSWSPFWNSKENTDSSCGI